MSPKNGQSHHPIEHLPAASTSFRVVKDSGGNPTDLIFRDVNPAFEAMFGLSKEEIIGKRAIDVFLETETINFDWLGKAAAVSSTARFEYYSELQRRSFEVTAYQDSSSHLLVVLRVMAQGEQVVGIPPKNHPEPELNAGEDRKQMKKALPESEEKLNFLAENVGDILWMLDSNLHITYLSQSVFNTLGFTPEEARERPLNERVTPESLAYVAETLQEELEREASGSADPERVRTMELEYYHKDGSIVSMEDYIKVLRDSQGKLTGFYGVSRDITRRKLAEDRLRVLKEEYETVFHGTRDALFLVEVIDNETFRYIRNNRSHEERTGLSAEQMKGKTPQELLGEEFGSRIALNYMRCVQAAAPLTYEETLELPAGTRTWTTTLTPVFQGDEIGYIVGSSQDITVSKEVEKRLMQNEERFQKMLSLIPDLISIHDPDMNIVYSNWRGFGAVPEEKRLYHTKCYRTYRGRDDICPDCLAIKVLQTKEAIRKEVELLEGIWVDWHIIPILGEDGSVELIVEWVSEITEQKQTERDIQNLVENAPDMIVRFNTRLEHIYCNAAVEQYFGVPGEYFLGKAFADLARETGEEDEGSFQVMNDTLKRCLETREEQHVELCFQLHGKEKYFSTRVVPEFSSSGHVESLLAVTRDTSSRKQAEQQIISQQKLLEGVMDNISDIIAIQYPDHSIERYNQAGYDLLGITPDEVRGRKCYELIGRDRECEECATRKALQHGKMGQLEKYVPELGVYLDCRSNLVLDEKGNIVRIVEQLRDITEHKKAEAALKASERKYREILSTIEEGYYETDLEGNFVFFNDNLCRVLGYNRDELMYLSYKKLFQKPEEVFKTFSRVYRTGKPETTASWPVITRDGREFFAEFSIVLRRDESGNPIGFRGIAKDVTERKHYEEKLKYLSLHDQLTGLYNRAFFEEEMKRLTESREYPITVISADLDELKLINDTMGHARGDELLQACAEVLRRSLRSSDILARVGGDEFAVLLPRTDRAGGEEIARRIQSNAAQHNRERPTLPVSISLGVAVAASKDITLEETYKKADDLMFREKRSNHDGARSKMIDSFLAALEERNHLNTGRAERLSALCRAMGKRLGLSSTRLANLHLLARGHDLGKVTVPEGILFKAGPLSEDERMIIRQHPEKGSAIAASSPEFSRVADLILKHHERWDGQGYPLGLKGEEIPLECRIFAIANAFDAMTGDRPHREKRSKEEALQELRRCAGTQFAPELVELFLEEFGKQTA